jgi:acetolactate synthase-1/3 small subunit
VLDVSHDAYVVEVTGDEGKLNAIINLCKPMGIKEVARTGKVVMMRGAKQKG